MAGGEEGDAVVTAFKATGIQPTGEGFKSPSCNSRKYCARMDSEGRRPFHSSQSTHSTIGGLVATKEEHRGITAQLPSVDIKGDRRGH